MALVLRLILLFFFNQSAHKVWPADAIIGGIALSSGDTPTYMEPAENLVNGLGYSMSENGDDPEPTGRRMPGFVVTYAPLYALFGPIWGKVMLILLQVLMSAVAAYYLAKTAYLLFGKPLHFYTAFFLFTLMAFVGIWDLYLYADAFGIAFTVLFWYAFVQLYQLGFQSLKWGLIGGIMILMAILFRAIAVLYLGPAALVTVVMLWRNRAGLFGNTRFRKVLFSGALLAVPFVLFEAFWLPRNQAIYGELYPLEAHSISYDQHYNPGWVAIRELTIGIGGDFVEWSVGQEMHWFLEGEGTAQHPFGSRDFCSCYNLDSLDAVRADYQRLSDGGVGLTGDNSMDELAEKVNGWHACYRSQRPFSYFLFNRMELLGQWLFQRRDRQPAYAGL